MPIANNYPLEIIMQTLEDKVNWLVDRALISDLMFSLAAAVDTKDYASYADCYSDDGYIEFNGSSSPTGATVIIHKKDMVATLPYALDPYPKTHHMSANHVITIDGSTATSRSYVQAVHTAPNLEIPWATAGWYDSWHIRASEGWKLSHVVYTAIWITGKPLGQSETFSALK
jgi:hypothetical protein